MPVPDCFFCLKEREKNPDYPVERGFIPCRMDGVRFDVCKKHLDEVNEKAHSSITSEGTVDVQR